MRQNILVIGSGAREHALAWKIAQSPDCGQIYVAPGNPGTARIATNVPIVPDTHAAIRQLADFAKVQGIALTIVGPEGPLALGIVDVFTAEGLRIFGPGSAAAELEISKSFAKNLMREAGIRTAGFEIFRVEDLDRAEACIRAHAMPVVIKASGPASGKGVAICHDMETALAVLREMMVGRKHGASGETVVIEDFLNGPEASVHALSDGNAFLMLPISRDHKRIGEGNTGENTGGMGSIAPLDGLAPEHAGYIKETIVRGTLDAMAAQGKSFRGCLYPGVLLSQSGPAVLEYNARFGDPETQVYMRLLESDLLALFNACVDGRLARHDVRWAEGYAVCVVLATAGYPAASSPAVPITGIAEAEAVPDVVVFQAGVRRDGGTLYTNGGRVLSVTATGTTIAAARMRAYEAVSKIDFAGMQYRRDIGV